MVSDTSATLRIGRFHDIPMENALNWVERYTDADTNRSSPEPYAYPAYDNFDEAANVPTVLSDGDLLVPGLLNVPISIRSFYDLQKIRPALQSVLADDDLSRPLAELAAERVAVLMRELFSVLDQIDTKPWGISGTTLSKVLHRKRPQAIPLHDAWVRTCYVSDDGPVPRAKDRTWGDYMGLVAQAMAHDLRTQPHQFAMLREASRAEPALTDLRVLDVVAWSQGRRSAVQLGEESANLDQ